MSTASLPERRRLRPYRAHGLYSKAEPPPAVRDAMESLRASLINDLGGPDAISTAQGLLVDLIVAAAVKHSHVASYLAAMPSLIDKRHRTTWKVVTDSTRLAAHMATLLQALGLERRDPLELSRQAIRAYLTGPSSQPPPGPIDLDPPALPSPKGPGSPEDQF